MVKAETSGWLSVDLVTYVLQLTVLLNAVDCFPNGGLYDGVYAIEAARRYERMWLPLLTRCNTAEEVHSMVPPLDVAWAWLVHRLNPVAYAKDLITVYGQSFYDRLMCAQLAPRFTAVFGPTKSKLSKGSLPGPFAFTDASRRSDRKGPYASFINATITAWAARRLEMGSQVVEPFFPPRPLPQLEQQQRSEFFTTNLSVHLPVAMGRQSAFLHSLLRPCYLERPFLDAAQQRYLRFLQLRRENPSMTLVPMMDIDVMWHTHMGLAAVYREDMLRLFDGKMFNHDDNLPEQLRLPAFDQTRLAYETRFPEAGPYNPPPTQLVPMAVPHPLEQLLGPLTQLFWAPADRTSLKPTDIAQGPNILPCAPPGRARHTGGHAVFLSWLLARSAGKVMTSRWHRWFKNEDQRKLASISKAVRKGLGFSHFLRLPLGMSHKYWGQFSIRNGTGWIPQDGTPGVAMGVPVGVDASGSGSGSSMQVVKAVKAPQQLKGEVLEGLPYAASGFCPGCGCSTAGCRCAVQSFNPFDMALLPVLVELAAAAQRKKDKEANQANSRGVVLVDGGMMYPYPYAYSYPDSAHLTSMATAPSWNADVNSAIGGDGAVVSGWTDSGPATTWDGMTGSGVTASAPCGAAACGGGGGGCGGGGCGGG